MNKYVYVKRYPEHVLKCFGAHAIASIGITDWLLISKFVFKYRGLAHLNWCAQADILLKSTDGN